MILEPASAKFTEDFIIVYVNQLLVGILPIFILNFIRILAVVLSVVDEPGD